MIEKGSWLCEYKTTSVFPQEEKPAVEAEYDANGEGSYIIDSSYPIPNEGHLCFDATRKFEQLGRYMNHAQRANARLSRPFKVRGKWRVGFLACRDIGVGDEVVWDYGVRGEDWSGCQLVGGVVKTATEIRGRGSKRAREVEGGQESEGGGEPEERQESERGGEPEGGQESEGGGEPVEKAKEARHDGAGLGKPPTKKKKQKLCMCPICHSGPHVKISNHLIQTHHILDKKKKERDRYLRDNRIIATPAQMHPSLCAGPSGQ